jgi:hypothetical protein
VPCSPALTFTAAALTKFKDAARSRVRREHIAKAQSGQSIEIGRLDRGARGGRELLCEEVGGIRHGSGTGEAVAWRQEGTEGQCFGEFGPTRGVGRGA